MNNYSKIKKPIGNMITSNKTDIIQTRKYLKELGFDEGHEEKPYIDMSLNKAIKEFQSEAGLKQNGIIAPKGDTERAINIELNIKESKPPLPNKKPKTREQKLEEFLQEAKDSKEDISLIKKLYDLIKKRNPIGFMKEISDQTKENINNDKHGTI